MAIVSKPDKDNKVTLYDIPDAELNKYKIAPDKAAQMFPKKESKSRKDAVAVSAASSGGDVQAYSQDTCCYWECYSDGSCVWVCWPC